MLSECKHHILKHMPKRLLCHKSSGFIMLTIRICMGLNEQIPLFWKLYRQLINLQCVLEEPVLVNNLLFEFLFFALLLQQTVVQFPCVIKKEGCLFNKAILQKSKMNLCKFKDPTKGTILANQKLSPTTFCLLQLLLSFVTAYNISPVCQRLMGESLQITAWVKH